MRATMLTVVVIALAGGRAFAQAPQPATTAALRPTSAGASAAIASDREQPLFRHPHINRAWHTCQASRRPMLVYVTADNCVFCKKMLRETFAHPQIGRGISGYSEPVVLNATEAPELAKKLGVRAYPTTLVISPDNELLSKIEGFVAPQEFADQVWPVFRQAAAARQVALQNVSATVAN